MARAKSAFAECKYCAAYLIATGSKETARRFAWGHPEGSSRWALYEPLRDASGAAVTAAGKALPDASKPHRCEHYETFKRLFAKGGVGRSIESVSDAGKVAREARPVVPEPEPEESGIVSEDGPEDGPESDDVPAPVASVIPAASAIPVADLGKPAARPPVKPAVKATLPEPETLLSSAALAAWGRYESLLTYPTRPLRVFAWGRPGTGKTELPWIVAQARGWTHIQQQLTEETPGVELTGHLIVQAGSTVWAHGTLGQAIEASHAGPVVYVLDEIGRASADALSAIILAGTNPESLRLRLRSGEVIAPKLENWHVVGTSNDDPRMLPEAVRSRFHLSVHLTSPAPGLVRTMTTPEARRMACSAAGEHDIRALLTYDRFRADGLSLEDAARLTWEPEVASSVIDACRLEGGAK